MRDRPMGWHPNQGVEGANDRGVLAVDGVDSPGWIARLGYQTGVLWLLFALGSPLWACAVGAPDPETVLPGENEPLVAEPPVEMGTVALDEATTSAAENEVDAGQAKAREMQRAVDSAIENIWWNRALTTELLQLSETQRRRMDEILDQYLRTVLSERQRRRPKAPNNFRSGLIDGDFEAARRGLDEIGERARLAGMREGEMMLEVLSVLSPEQFETFRTRRAGLLNRSWLLLLGGERLGRTKGAGRRRPRPGNEP